MRQHILWHLVIMRQPFYYHRSLLLSIAITTFNTASVYVYYILTTLACRSGVSVCMWISHTELLRFHHLFVWLVLGVYVYMRVYDANHLPHTYAYASLIVRYWYFFKDNCDCRLRMCNSTKHPHLPPTMQTQKTANKQTTIIAFEGYFVLFTQSYFYINFNI